MGLISVFTGNDDDDFDFSNSGTGNNSFFAKPFGSGKGSVKEFFSPTNPNVGKARHTMTGFDPSEVADFQKAAGSLASARKRVDVEGFAPKQKTFKVTTKERNRQTREGHTLSVNADQMKGFVSAFNLRQDEVFSKRATPGISQTRLV